MKINVVAATMLLLLFIIDDIEQQKILEFRQIIYLKVAYSFTVK